MSDRRFALFGIVILEIVLLQFLPVFGLIVPLAAAYLIYVYRNEARLITLLDALSVGVVLDIVAPSTQYSYTIMWLSLSGAIIFLADLERRAGATLRTAQYALLLALVTPFTVFITDIASGQIVSSRFYVGSLFIMTLVYIGTVGTYGVLLQHVRKVV